MLLIVGCLVGGVFGKVGNAIEDIGSSYKENKEAATYAAALYAKVSGDDLVSDAFTSAEVEAAKANTGWIKQGAHNLWRSITSAAAGILPGGMTKDEYSKKSDEDWAHKQYNKNEDVKAYANALFTNQKESIDAARKQEVQEAKKEEQQEKTASLTAMLPLLIIPIVVILLVVLFMCIRSKSAAKPVTEVSTSANVNKTGEVGVNYNRLLKCLCSERGLIPDEQIATYGSARAAVEALNVT